MLLPRIILLAVAILVAHLDGSTAAAQTVQRGSQRPDATALPVTFASPLPGARLSSRFGLRKHPILGVTMMHQGLDLAAPAGTPIRAAASGVVAETGRDGGYGNFVRLRHDGRMETLYGHMSRIAATPGQPISLGAVIGYVGSTGLANGPHLHFEVRQDGVPVDPAASGRMPLPPSVSDRTRLVDVVRGGRAATASGGPESAHAGSVQVVRGRRR